MSRREIAVAVDLSSEEMEKLLKSGAQEKELVAEWWEIWLNRGKFFESRVMPEAEEMSKNLLIPVHGFESKEVARRTLARLHSPCVKLIHVRRTRKVK